MRRLALLLVSVSLVLTACAPGGPSTESTVATGGDDVSTSTPDSGPTISGDTSGTTAAPGETTTTSDRPLAPDFTLELGEGGSYTLSEGAKPVYLVFWAEW